MTKYIKWGILFMLPFLTLLQSCDDDETYADKLKRERKQIEGFLQSGTQVVDDDSGDYLLNVPGNIQIISEEEFLRNDSTTDVSKNQYVLFSNSGLYMQIVDKGSGEKLAPGESCNIIVRYTEFDIATDSIKTYNRTIAYEMQPDIMHCSNNSGTISATFRSGLMATTYQTTAVPTGWITPLSYVNLGRLDSPEASLAHVRLIVPSGVGQKDAAANIYPCFYDITYQRAK